ncbi:MAG TPA: HEAT repeat domain-containing protein, partial [Bryobacteraceae bacterium]
MSPQDCTADAVSREIRERLELSVRNFDRDSVGHGRVIRELMRENPQVFYSNAIEILTNQDGSRGSHFLLTTLVDNHLLLPALQDPSLTREQSTALARAAARGGQMVDVAIARHLAEKAESLTDENCPPEMQRLMEILAETSDGTRILPSLMALARMQNPYLQSKAVLMVGRIHRNVKWVQNRLADPDSRVRANAIEAIWGLDSEEARRLLRSAARDANNRVAGNALLGLYRLGDCWAIPEVIAMATHESRQFRASAAWVMGETGDPRFTKVLARLVSEPNNTVRTRVFAALAQIKAATAQARHAGEWRVIARFLPKGRPGSREVQVEVCSNDGKEQIKLLPTQFILSEDGQNMTTYSVEERQVPRALAIAFLYPRTTEPADASFNQGSLRALTWKRPADLWSTVPYLATASADVQTTLLEQKIAVATSVGTTEEDLPLQFTQDPDLAAEALLKVQPKLDCANLWSAIRRAVQIDTGPARGQRHVIVFSQWETGQPVGYPEIASSALNSPTCVHAISLNP